MALRPRRLYLRLYLAFLGVMVAEFALSLGASFLLGRGGLRLFLRGARFAEHPARLLPPAADVEGTIRTVQQIHDEVGVDVSIVDRNGNLIASAGGPLPLDPHRAGT